MNTMPYQVLARKWRPKKFEDVVGQSHITQSLKNALIRNEIGHAYLFAGTRGIGKTSVARIFAKAIQCQNPVDGGNPCLQCGPCQDIDRDQSLDVLEIDGASHNGVDHIRQLVENVQYLPVSGRKRIYIIDEVHMLTKEAFNALLKTLEEPPSHVIFLFATTVPEKLLGTVLSRCQRFDFRNAQVEDVLQHLNWVAKQEGITLESPELLRQLAIEAKGSVRDALSLLDQVLSFSLDRRITEAMLVVSLGLARTSAIRDLLSAILLGQAEQGSRVYREVLRENVDLEKLAQAVMDGFYHIIQGRRDPSSLVRRGLIQEGALQSVGQAELFWIYESLAKDLQWALKSLDPEKVTEIVLQKVCLRREFFSPSSRWSSEGTRTGGPASPAGEGTSAERRDLESPATVTAAPESLAPEPDPVPQADDSTPEAGGTGAAEEEMRSHDDEDETPAGTENPYPLPLSASSELTRPSESLAPKAAAELGNKSWYGFIQFLFKASPGLAAHVEQGNILQPLAVGEDGLKVELRFRESGQVFLDFLREKSTFDRLQGLLADYLSLPRSQVTLNLDLHRPQEAGEGEFLTYAEMEKTRRQEIQQKREEEFLGHLMIQRAQELFHAKIDRIIINGPTGEV